MARARDDDVAAGVASAGRALRMEVAGGVQVATSPIARGGAALVPAPRHPGRMAAHRNRALTDCSVGSVALQ